MNHQTLNSSQMLRLASVDPFEYTEKLDHLVKQVLALFATAKMDDAAELPNKLGRLIQESSRVSIATCLSRLHSVATIGKELEGDHDGLDALCYHLCGGTVRKGQEALRDISRRFEALTKEQDAEIDRLHKSVSKV